MSSPSSLISFGLGPWGSPGLVLTAGLGASPPPPGVPPDARYVADAPARAFAVEYEVIERSASRSVANYEVKP